MSVQFVIVATVSILVTVYLGGRADSPRLESRTQEFGTGAGYVVVGTTSNLPGAGQVATDLALDETMVEQS